MSVVDEGHHLVRGVAGSGKTFVLANWLARFVLEDSSRRVLVSYFNKALRPLIERLVTAALEDKSKVAAGAALRRISFRHVDVLKSYNPGSFDGVFVDEAQDMRPGQLRLLYTLAAPVKTQDGSTRRAFYLFMDDSQNIRANKPLEELKMVLSEDVSFTGRVRVLREAFRSTRDILDFAFNVVLDPHDQHRVPDPRMRDFMKVRELHEHQLLQDPKEIFDALFHVSYTERTGVTPIVRGFSSEQKELAWIAREVKRLVHEEGVHPADILLVRLARPSILEYELEKFKIPARSFGGSQGEDTGNFPVGRVGYVRVTTISSCKGHEGPIVFLAGVNALDDAGWFKEDNPGLDARALERMRRAFFYVGSTRAMVRQYVTGLASSRFLRTSAYYADALRNAGVVDVRKPAEP